LILSANGYNQTASGLVIVAPITKTQRAIPTNIPISTVESGLDYDSTIQCDQVRSISVERLSKRIGHQLTGKVMAKVEDTLKILLNLR
jgi:mRNA interferase MazF